MMRLPQKIKQYFKKRDFHLWKEAPKKEGFVFQQINADVLTEIAGYLLKNLSASDAAFDRKHRLKENRAKIFSNLDDLVSWLGQILEKDASETLWECRENEWSYQYSVRPHTLSEGTIVIANLLSANKKENSHCLYTMASVRKSGGKFYGWES